MYQYIYDTFLSDKRYKKLLAELENRLTDLGIQGRTDRLTPFKSLRESLEDGIRAGARAVIAVGTDETLKKLLDLVPGRGIVLGFIPLFEGSAFAKLLGIPTGVEACDVLSARLTTTLDIGRVNGQYFLSSVSLPSKDVTIECEGRYRIELKSGGQVSVCNIAPSEGDEHPRYGNPYDGYLDAVLEPESQGLLWKSSPEKSVFPLRRVVARADRPFVFYADGRELRGQTVEIDLAKERLRMIVGKQRVFMDAA